MQSKPSYRLVQEVQDWLVLIHNQKHVSVNFCWIPAHVGVEGNERADRAAKEASEIFNASQISIPFKDFKSKIHFYFKEKWQSRWSSLTTNVKLKSIHPSVDKWLMCNPPNRRDSVILTRLRIGHTHATHSYLLKSGVERHIPLCSTCYVNLTVKHILIECPNFNNQRRANSVQGRSLSELLGDLCNVDYLMKFLKNIDFYFKF